MPRYEVRVSPADAAYVLDIPLSELLDMLDTGELSVAGESPNQTLNLDQVEAMAATRLSTRGRVRRRSPHTYFVAVAGAAEILGVSRQRVKQLTAAGRIPYLTTAWGDRIYRRGQLEVVANARLARGLGSSVVRLARLRPVAVSDEVGVRDNHRPDGLEGTADSVV